MTPRSPRAGAGRDSVPFRHELQHLPVLVQLVQLPVLSQH